MKIAVIILNYNSASDCRKCVSFLKRQDGVELEIIIVDNASPRAGERETVEELCELEGCTFLASPENHGYNAGNNIGLRYAAEKGYTYALIANPDMEFPQQGFVAALVHKMEEDKRIVVCSGDILTPEGLHQNPQREATYYEELFWMFTTLRNLRSKKWFSLDWQGSRVVEKVSGCCLMLRVDFVRQIGFFDENVFLYSEEPILRQQVLSAGKHMYYLSEVSALHRHVKGEKGNPRGRMKAFFKSRDYYLRKYSGYTGMKLRLLFMSCYIHKIVYGII